MGRDRRGRAGRSTRACDAGDVRLTVGGEPTFVSIDDRDARRMEHRGRRARRSGSAPTISSSACAPASRPAACCITARASGTRASSCRAGPSPSTGAATASRLWRDPALVADEEPPAGATLAQAERFITALTERLGLDPSHIACRPTRIRRISCSRSDCCRRTSIRSTTGSTIRRSASRLARVFDRGLDRPAGFVLPIQRWQARAGPFWRSERWRTRRGRLFLMPGDSPVGYRLPLSALPHVEPKPTTRTSMPLDPFAARAALPARPPVMQGRASAGTGGPRQPARRSSAVRTALAVEPRDGHLCVFMPPTEDAEDYVELVHAIEDTRRGTGAAGPASRATRRRTTLASTSSR